MISNSISQNLILTGGYIYQNDGSFSDDEIILCENGRITFIGSELNLSDSIDIKRIDVTGKYIYPGFIDSHLHLLSYGNSLDILNLAGTKNAEEIAKIISNSLNTNHPDKWILGRGWDQNDWENRSFPDKKILDAIAPETPVVLTRIDGHAIWVNSKAMDVSGITDETENPYGGEIFRDSHGSPTGIFLDNAISLVQDRIPSSSRDQKQYYLLKAIDSLNQMGITSIHDAGIEEETISILQELIDNHKISLRVYGMLTDDPELYRPYLTKGPIVGYGDDYLTVRSIKLYMDGALGSRGAALKQPYSDDPENSGLLLTSRDIVENLVFEAFTHGFQVNIHAIGDRANTLCLNIFAKNLTKNPGDHRPRIEHAQILDPLDILRFAELGVIPSMQPTHCTSDMPWVEDRLGKDRLEGAYPWRSLIDSGAIIPGGSDAPVEHPDPLWGIYSAVTRSDHSGNPPNGWLPKQKVSRVEAIKMFTEWGAYAAFEENTKGSVKEGFLADLVVLDKNIIEISTDEILKTQVVMTIVGGEIVYSVE